MGARILVADDSVTIQKVVELTFSKEDFQIVPARSGEEAIRKAREVRPDLMLIDLVMPDKSGYEVCEALRKDPLLKDIPIILLTGTFEAFDKNEGARVGANDFVTKPFESQVLIGKVKQLLFARSMPGSPPPARSSPAASATLGSPPPVPPAPAPFPAQTVSERGRGVAAPAPPVAFGAPAAGGGGEGEVSEEKLWELLEHEEPGRGAAYVLPEEGGPSLKLGPPVEEGLRKTPAAPEEEKVFSLDEGGDLASSIKDMAESLGLPMEPPLLVDVEGPVPAPPSSAPVKKPASMEPVEDLTIPLLESLEILPEEGPALTPPVPPRPAPPVAAPPAPSAPSHLMNVDQVTREITDNVARAIVQEVSERLAGKIERIVWEVVPDLAEHLITQEIERIKAQAEGPPEKA